MKWKTVLQLLYVGLMAFGVWLARANAETSIAEMTDPDLEISVVVVQSGLPEAPAKRAPAEAEPATVVTIAQHQVKKDGESTLPVETKKTEELLEETIVAERGPATASEKKEPTPEELDPVCYDKRAFADTHIVHRFRFRNNICGIFVDEKDVYPKRSLAFTDKGKVLVQMQFVPASKGKDPKGGASGYYLVPASNVLDIEPTSDRDSDVEVKTSPEMIWSVSKTERSLRLPSECSGKVELPTLANKGGVQIQKCQNRLVIDMGWGQGETPEFKKGDGFANGTGVATIRDPNGKSCRVGFNEFLRYKHGSQYQEHEQGESEPKFETPNEWHRFLSNHPDCRVLSLDFLKSPKILLSLVPRQSLSVEPVSVTKEKLPVMDIENVQVELPKPELPERRGWFRNRERRSGTAK